MNVHSSSRSSWSLWSGRASSYWKSFLNCSSLAMDRSKGFPVARLSLSLARFSLISASFNRSALR